VNTAYAQSRKHPPLIDLDAIPNPVLKTLMPVFGPLLRKLFAIDAINDVHDQADRDRHGRSVSPRVLQIVGARYECQSRLGAHTGDGASRSRVQSSPWRPGWHNPGDLLRRRRKDTKMMANFLLKRVKHADAHMFFVDPFPRKRPCGRTLRGCATV